MQRDTNKRLHTHMVHAISVADELLPGSPVRFSTGVPYIQMNLFEIRDMGMVGYDGAQLLETIGNALENCGVGW